jgi:hypothetical protein
LERDIAAAPTSLAVPGRGRRHSILALQQSAGNQAVSRLLAGQRGASPARRLNRRRLPDAAHADPLVASGSTDRLQHAGGLEHLNRLALAELSAADRATVMHQADTRAGSHAAYVALPAPDRARLLADVLRTFRPALTLGDPALINTGPRGPQDRTNIATLVTGAATLIGIVTGGSHNNDLRDVFGAANVATAIARYQAALSRMNFLHTNDRIVTDRSGYNAEVGLGGLTNANRIALAPQTIDAPTSQENVVLLIHEAMHAGNPGIVGDRGYRNSPSFVSLDEPIKLGNAAHYEVVPRRVRSLAFAYPGVVFVPAGTTTIIGGVPHTAPALTPIEQASRDASEQARTAWNMGLNLHNLWVRLNLHRADWTGVNVAAVYTGASAARFADCMPYWSKVLGLTVHQRPGLSPGAATPSTAPVTQIDVALSEAVVRRIMQVKNLAAQQLGSQAAATTFLNAHTTAQERALTVGVAATTTLLLTALRRVVGEITGSETRDVRVINTMAAAPTYGQMLVARSPSTFP